MHLYRQSIALFGIALPAVGCILLVVVAFAAKSKVQASFEKKQVDFKNFKQNRVQALSLAAEITNKRSSYERWQELLSKETASALTSNLRSIEAKLPSKEFQLTEQQTPPNSRGGFGAASAQTSSHVKLGFRATYRSMQRALLELETRMPQLQLQSLNMRPSAGSNNMNFEIHYTAWEQ